MPGFHYEAVDATGKVRRGQLDADTPRAARERLRGDGLFPTEILLFLLLCFPKMFFDRSLGGNTRVISAWQPERLVAAHSRTPTPRRRRPTNSGRSADR